MQLVSGDLPWAVEALVSRPTITLRWCREAGMVTNSW